MEPADLSATPTIVNIDDNIIAINLQLDEIRSFSSVGKEKYRDGKAADYELAIQDFEAELDKLLLVFNDQNLAQSIERVVDDDADLLRVLIADEDQALRDSAISPTVGDGLSDTDASASLNRVAPLEINDDEVEDILDKSFTSHSGEALAGPSRSSTDHKQAHFDSFLHLSNNCIACRETISEKEIIQTPCGDLYCAECLQSLFISATKDETLFPPRCCGQTIPLSLTETRLPPETLSAFRVAEIEFSTANRTYCANTDCGRFIPLIDIHSGCALCSGCNVGTCVYCKGTFHNGDCPEDKALQEVLTLAQVENWRRCYSCQTMVELNKGCNHITCKCSAEFCYACGVRWKECTCDAWQEQNLLNRAEEVVHREMDGRLIAQDLHQIVAQMQNHLLANHECTHRGHWHRQEGFRQDAYLCELCGAQHRKYIMRCRRCHLTACEYCVRHRI